MSQQISHQARAVVTGAGSGIGRAFARQLARRGGQVVCADIRLEAAEQTAREIRDGGGEALAVACDVADRAQLEQLAEAAETFFAAPADLLINNAGVGAGGQRVDEIAIEDWRRVIEINLWGVINGCHVFLPRLRALGRGGVVNVGSTASFAAAPLMGAYNVSKAGVLALSETLAAELQGSGVRVTALCPTFVKTDIVAAGQREGRIAEQASGLAGRLMRWTGMSPERVAREALDALDRGQLYVLPQADARAIWRLKRLAPRSYARGAGLLQRVLGARR